MLLHRGGVIGAKCNRNSRLACPHRMHRPDARPSHWATGSAGLPACEKTAHQHRIQTKLPAAISKSWWAGMTKWNVSLQPSPAIDKYFWLMHAQCESPRPIPTMTQWEKERKPTLKRETRYPIRFSVKH